VFTFGRKDGRVKGGSKKGDRDRRDALIDEYGTFRAPPHRSFPAPTPRLRPQFHELVCGQTASVLFFADHEPTTQDHPQAHRDPS
jgi:hypothetical protein